eukprot:2297005-Rhodomonas_salina.1
MTLVFEIRLTSMLGSAPEGGGHMVLRNRLPSAPSAAHPTTNGNGQERKKSAVTKEEQEGRGSYSVWRA